MFDTIFFWASKLIWAVLSPGNLLALLVASGILCLYAGSIVKAKIILGLAGLAMVAITVLPLGQWVYQPLEERFPVNPDLPERADGIIMLAGAERSYTSYVWGQPELNTAGERYIGFIALMRRYPDAACIFTGGSGSLSRGQFKDAHVARKVFERLGVDLSRIMFEAQSRNTYENGLFSRKMADPKPGQNWILVTTAAHMPRSVGVFEQIGWQVIPYPVDHSTLPGERFSLSLNFAGNLDLLTRGAREWIGLIAYRLTGKTSALFPPASD